MNRLLRNVLALLVGVILGGLSVLSHASTSYPPTNAWSHPWSVNTGDFASVADVCAFDVALPGWQTASPGYTFTCVNINQPSNPEPGVTYGTYQVKAQKDANVFYTSRTTYFYSRCPDGGTLTGGVCVVPDNCPEAGTPQSSGWFLMGPSPTSSFPGVTCAGTCLVVFSGYAPAGEAIQNGVKQYYARGTWQYLGPSNTCSGGTSTPSASQSLPPDTCAPGQYYGTINGKPVCVDATTGQPANTSPASPSTTTTQTDNTTNPDGSTTKTTTTTNPDGSTTTTTTTTQPNGNSTTTTTTTPPPGEDQTDDFCKKNPDSPMCQEIESGSPAGTSDLYTPESRTVGNVLSDFRGKIQNAPFYSGASNFFNISVPGGSCGGMNAQIAVGWGQSFNIDIDSVLCGSTAQLVYSVLGIGVMLAAAWVAFRIAIL